MPGRTFAPLRQRIVVTGLGPLLGVLLVVAGCTRADREPRPAAEGDAGRAAPDDRPRVVASIFPVADLARTLAGDALRVDVLLPPRASPDTFEPAPRTVEAVSGARLHLLVGGGLDRWATSLLQGSSDARIVLLTEGTKLVGGTGAPGSGNPHVWLDPVRVRDDVLPVLVEALARLAPDAADGIRERAGALADTLRALDREIDAALAPVRDRPFVTTHPAWLYYVDRYDLVEVGSIHPRPGQEPSARALADLVDTARRAGVRVVFAEPQVAGTAAAALAGELGLPLITLDPLGGPGLPGRESYTALLRYNTAQIVRALEDGGG